MIFGWIFAIFLALVPVYLFAYSAARFDERPTLMRSRFWFGAIF